MADLDLDALEAAAKAATPGPWESEKYGICSYAGGDYHGVVSWDYPWGDSNPRAAEDSEFIVLANPAAVLALVAEVRRLRAKCPDPEAFAWIADMIRAEADIAGLPDEDVGSASEGLLAAVEWLSLVGDSDD